MNLDVPDLSSIFPRLMKVESTFMGQKNSIAGWLENHRKDLQANLDLIRNPSDTDDISILLSFLGNLLVRAMRGEAGERTHQALKSVIKDKSCLQEALYREALKKASYRWGVDAGSALISEVVCYFRDRLNWNWRVYLDMASAHTDNDFADDFLLSIKNIGFKVRDLALSCFEPSYAAFDLHVARVPTRIGLLNYGFELLGDPKLEMGNNPTDEKNYLFLHRLFLRLSELTENAISPAELDRIFWHFGRTCCGARPRCGECPINDECLMGKHGRWRRQERKVKRPHGQGQ